MVIGAGLAGLRCATRLAGAGLGVVVVEAEPVVGGRVRTEVVDDHLLDRGFQVLNPAYPAVRRWVDVDALALRSFPVAVGVRRERGWAELAHPLRHPGRIPAMLRSGLLGPADVAATARWLAPALLRPRSVIAGPDRELAEAWDQIGLTGPLRTEVLEPFLAGVLADDTGTTSESFARLLMRMFVLGAPGVPAGGMGELPAQLAASARAAGADIRLGRRADRIRTGGRNGTVHVEIDGAGVLAAAAVVVAVGPDAVAGLLSLPSPPTRALQTWWFASDVAPTASALLAVDGRRRGPVVNAVVISHTAPSYSPRGSHLVAATCLLSDGAPGDRSGNLGSATEAEVRRHVGEIWATDASGWRLLRRDDVHHALPAQPPPLRTTRPARLDRGLYVAGDHRDTASIQGALVSGDRVGRAVLADLAGGAANDGREQGRRGGPGTERS